MQQLHCSSAATLFGQQLAQQGKAIQLWMLPLSHKISSRIHHLPCFERLACHPTPTLSLYASPNLCSVLVCFLWEVELTCILALKVQLLTPLPFSMAGSVLYLLHYRC
jgi:hypothetical protein